MFFEREKNSILPHLSHLFALICFLSTLNMFLQTETDCTKLMCHIEGHRLEFERLLLWWSTHRVIILYACFTLTHSKWTSHVLLFPSLSRRSQTFGLHCNLQSTCAPLACGVSGDWGLTERLAFVNQLKIERRVNLHVFHVILTCNEIIKCSHVCKQGPRNVVTMPACLVTPVFFIIYYFLCNAIIFKGFIASYLVVSYKRKLNKGNCNDFCHV